MYLGRRALKVEPSHFRQKRRTRFIQERFQIKYTLFLIIAVTLTLLISGGPIYYFARQNYQIFMKLAYTSAPELIAHLTREWAWIHIFLAVAFIGVLSVCAYISIHITTRMVVPLNLMEDHLKKLSHGNWNIPNLRIRSGDEFQELIQVYNYFYNSLKANAEAELQMLQKISVEPKNPEAQHHWEKLLALKSSLLGINHPLKTIGEGSAESRDLRHVS